MYKLVLFSFLVSTCVARPSSPFEYHVLENLNIVTVPPNCPPGQEYINGQCRDVWRVNVVDIETQNIVTVPPNCPPGQEYINGQCRDVWIKIAHNDDTPKPLMSENIISVVDCNPRQVRLNGKCLDLLRTEERKPEIIIGGDEDDTELDNRNVISVPNHKCPDGYKLDVNGVCRELFD